MYSTSFMRKPLCRGSTVNAFLWTHTTLLTKSTVFIREFMKKSICEGMHMMAIT